MFYYKFLDFEFICSIFVSIDSIGQAVTNDGLSDLDFQLWVDDEEWIVRRDLTQPAYLSVDVVSITAAAGLLGGGLIGLLGFKRRLKKK